MDTDFLFFEESLHDNGIAFINEATLISIIEEYKKPFNVWCAVILLAKYGSVAALPILQKAMYYPMQDVKMSSLWAISQIEKGEGWHIYTAALEDPKYRKKSVAIRAIAEYCDEQAVKPVIARVKKILASKKLSPRLISLGNNQYTTEIEMAASYLAKHAANHPELPQLLQDISAFLKEHKAD